MSLSTDARTRLGIATTDFTIGDEIADAIDASVSVSGAQTIAGDKTFTGIVTAANMAEGEATVLAGQSSIVVTDAGASATSTVVATPAGTDATALYVRYVARGSGTFTIHVGPATATADLKVTWIRFN